MIGKQMIENRLFAIKIMFECYMFKTKVKHRFAVLCKICVEICNHPLSWSLLRRTPRCSTLYSSTATKTEGMALRAMETAQLRALT